MHSRHPWSFDTVTTVQHAKDGMFHQYVERRRAKFSHKLAGAKQIDHLRKRRFFLVAWQKRKNFRKIIPVASQFWATSTDVVRAAHHGVEDFRCGVAPPCFVYWTTVEIIFIMLFLVNIITMRLYGSFYVILSTVIPTLINCQLRPREKELYEGGDASCEPLEIPFCRKMGKYDLFVISILWSFYDTETKHNQWKWQKFTKKTRMKHIPRERKRKCHTAKSFHSNIKLRGIDAQNFTHKIVSKLVVWFFRLSETGLQILWHRDKMKVPPRMILYIWKSLWNDFKLFHYCYTLFAI